jgi:hypothetical protein
MSKREVGRWIDESVTGSGQSLAGLWRAQRTGWHHMSRYQATAQRARPLRERRRARIGGQSSVLPKPKHVGGTVSSILMYGEPKISSC